jgi:hypothetical protein
MKKARSEYMRKLTRVRIRTNKIKRADEFCIGWASAVVRKLRILTNTPAEEKAIGNYVGNLNWGKNLKTISRDAIKNLQINDYANGRRAADGVEIQHGVEGHSRGSLLLGADNAQP